MQGRDLILWQPGRAGRIGLLAACTRLILRLAYLHTLTGLTYEFHVFFAAPLALVAWYLGLPADRGVTFLVAGVWFWGDRTLETTPADLLPMIFKPSGRLSR